MLDRAHFHLCVTEKGFKLECKAMVHKNILRYDLSLREHNWLRVSRL